MALDSSTINCRRVSNRAAAPKKVKATSSPNVVTGAAAATWIYALGALMPVALTVLALRLLWLHRQRSIAYNALNIP
jgi:hypothetical protein